MEERFKKEKSHAKAQRRKVFPAISRLNQFNYWHLQHLVRPRITKAFLYFLSLRLGAFA
jgi:hypothetical protein